MNYQRIHDQIIEESRKNPTSGYKEEHHIVPRCMGGGSDQGNLVFLTARCHFLIHWLLTKIHPNNPRIALAFRFMFYGNRFHARSADPKWNRTAMTSRLYEHHKSSFAKAQSIRRSGTTSSDATKEKLSRSLKLWYQTHTRKHSEETKNKMRVAKIGMKHSAATIAKFMGRKPTPNTIASIIERHSKDWVVTTPDGIVHTINNLSQYCRDNGLNRSSVSAVLNGKLKHHRGYLFRPASDK